MFGENYPLLKLAPWFGGQLGIDGSENPLGFRSEPQGVVYYVDGVTGNDSNWGTDPKSPVATIGRAIALHNATAINWAATPPYAGIDLIVISPGVYAENLTPPYYCNVLGLGHANGGDWDVIVEPAAGSALTGNGNYTCWKNIKFMCNDANPVMDLNVANSMIVEDCQIVSGNAGLATYGIDIQNASGCKFINNNFNHHAAPFVQAALRCTGNFFDCVVRGNKMTAALVGIDLLGGGLQGNSLVDHNYIWGPADGIATATNDLFVTDNFVMSTNANPSAIIHPALATHAIANHVIENGVASVQANGTT